MLGSSNLTELRALVRPIITPSVIKAVPKLPAALPTIINITKRMKCQGNIVSNVFTNAIYITLKESKQRPNASDAPTTKRNFEEDNSPNSVRRIAETLMNTKISIDKGKRPSTRPNHTVNLNFSFGSSHFNSAFSIFMCFGVVASKTLSILSSYIDHVFSIHLVNFFSFKLVAKLTKSSSFFEILSHKGNKMHAQKPSATLSTNNKAYTTDLCVSFIPAESIQSQILML